MGYVSELRKIVGKRALMVPAACVFLFNKNREILLVKRADDGFWCAPAGGIEPGEAPEEGARREVFEETGLTLGDLTLFSVSGGEDCHFIYPNGNESYAIDINYLCFEHFGVIKVQEIEVDCAKFFDLSNLPEKLGIKEGKVIKEIEEKIFKNT